MARRFFFNRQTARGYLAEADLHPKRKWTLAFTRRGGRSPERAQRGREAPAAQDACPRQPAAIENFLGGAPGGMQGGPRRGRSPITGPALLHAAQASQTPPEGKTHCPKGSKKHKPHRRNRTPHRRPKLRRTAKIRARRAAKPDASPVPGGETPRSNGLQ